MSEEKKILIVEAYGDSHEDSYYDNDWEEAVLATFDMQTAKDSIVELEKEQALRKKIKEERHKLEEEYEDENPPPKAEEEPKIKKWRSGITGTEITPAMREERDATIRKISEIRERYREKRKVWEEAREEFIVNNLLGMEFPEAEIKESKNSWYGCGTKHYRIVVLPFK